MPSGLLALAGAAVRLRCAAVAADGARHRLDDRGRAVRREPAGRGRPHGGVRHRAAACCAPRGSCCSRLLRSPLRWSGAVVVVAATLWAVRAPLPDVFVSDRGDIVAVRGASGRLAVMRTGGSRRLRAARVARGRCRCARAERSGRCATASIATTSAAWRGSPTARSWRCRSPRRPSRRTAARAALVVSQRTAPPGCAAPAIDRTVWPTSGASVLYRKGRVWETVAAYPAGYDRPWAKAAPRQDGATLPATATAREATPRAEDLSADD